MKKVISKIVPDELILEHEELITKYYCDRCGEEAKNLWECGQAGGWGANFDGCKREVCGNCFGGEWELEADTWGGDYRAPYYCIDCLNVRKSYERQLTSIRHQEEVILQAIENESKRFGREKIK
ncbi:hypothetical protein M0R19_05965 [Candidatus Pacearchaeota archaeon]|jgi:hypothetical protein|nr:hypothetical protein [Candidatus Pacearchaeota archaeon]